ncbi:MAG: glycosyltransferase, partial [Terrimicrobiaceae bacterium]|nr:glycosyltransferase [Terrimicrobiaceae bacterium]
IRDRAMTACGWVIGGEGTGSRAELRQRWGVPQEAIVIGLAGSLVWNARRPWCYGLDLVRAVRSLRREDVCAVIVGGGSGLEPLRREAGPRLGRQIFLPGPVPLGEVVPCLRAMDIGSLPQSTDAVGASRYTTKLPEFAAAGLPVATNRVPMAYDLGLDWMWRLPGHAPWEPDYQRALDDFLERITRGEIAEKASKVPGRIEVFDSAFQARAVAAFVRDILGEMP